MLCAFFSDLNLSFPPDDITGFEGPGGESSLSGIVLIGPFRSENEYEYEIEGTSTTFKFQISHIPKLSLFPAVYQQIRRP